MSDEEPTLTLEDCEHEIRSLHSFFAAWYTGSDEANFDRFEDALAPSFEMVTPDGEVLAQDGITGYVRENYGEHEGKDFGIEIRNVEAIETRARRALVRYEERQEREGSENARVSTALFRTSDEAPEGVEWMYLHETWLKG